MKPLAGFRILDLSALLPGAYAAMLLADLGAEVIKIEPPGGGDPGRNIMPYMHEAVNCDKKSLVLSLKTSGGRQIFYRLVSGSDVIIENFRPGVVKRLGVDYETVKRYNPRIIYCSVTGYGQSGPYSSSPAHDVVCMGLSGVLSIPGDFKSQPIRPGLPLSDLSSAMFSALSVVSALAGRMRNDKGTYIDVSMLEGLFSWAGIREGQYLMTGNLSGQDEMEHLFPTNRVFITADKRHIALGVVEENYWKKLCTILGKEEWIEDERFATNEKRRKNYHTLIPLLEEIFNSKTLEEWKRYLAGEDLPWGPVNDFSEACGDPHVKERGIIENLEKNGKTLRQVKYPATFSAFTTKKQSPAPSPGEHSTEILKELRYSDSDIEKLKKEGAVEWE